MRRPLVPSTEGVCCTMIDPGLQWCRASAKRSGTRLGRVGRRPEGAIPHAYIYVYPPSQTTAYRYSSWLRAGRGSISTAIEAVAAAIPTYGPGESCPDRGPWRQLLALASEQREEDREAPRLPLASLFPLACVDRNVGLAVRIKP